MVFPCLRKLSRSSGSPGNGRLPFHIFFSFPLRQLVNSPVRTYHVTRSNLILRFCYDSFPFPLARYNYPTQASVYEHCGVLSHLILDPVVRLTRVDDCLVASDGAAPPHRYQLRPKGYFKSTCPAIRFYEMPPWVMPRKLSTSYHLPAFYLN